MKTLVQLFAIAGILAACGAPAVPAARFHNTPVVTTVNDRVATPVAPAPRTYVRALVHVRGSVIRPIKRALDLPRERRALGVNALDEVPNSTWFTNRIGVRDLSPDEIRTGPTVAGNPEAHLPWTVLSTKVGGANIGFIITDARGEKFILKFDKPGFPETETAAGVIVGRLLWGAGYNVPEDHIVYFRSKDLVLSPKAKIKDVFGNSKALTRAELEKMLTLVDVETDGRIRGLASHMLAGTWLGGHPSQGTRADDPNDRIAHEMRRDLRGSFAIFGWLDHTDIKEDNYLDMFVADPAAPEHKYVKHYMVDFGSGLGSTARTSYSHRPGHEYLADFPAMLTSFASLGLHERSWEGRSVAPLRGVGLYDASAFSPGSWKPNNASYLPFHTADRYDNFWGAKILARFTPAQIRAAVETGRLSDPKAAAYLTQTLIERQRMAARYWFSQVAPLDRPEVVLAAGGYQVCFDDLMLAHELSSVATTYSVTTYDKAGKPAAAQAPITASASGHSCTGPLTLGGGDDAYTITEIRTVRPGLDASTYVHLARDGGAMKVVGIWRQ